MGSIWCWLFGHKPKVIRHGLLRMQVTVLCERCGESMSADLVEGSIEADPTGEETEMPPDPGFTTG